MVFKISHFRWNVKKFWLTEKTILVSNNFFIEHGEVAELAEGARLLSECTGNTVPRVRIPLSPPDKTSKPYIYYVPFKLYINAERWLSGWKRAPAKGMSGLNRTGGSNPLPSARTYTNGTWFLSTMVDSNEEVLVIYVNKTLHGIGFSLCRVADPYAY